MSFNRMIFNSMCMCSVFRRLAECSAAAGAALSSEDRDRATVALLNISQSLPTLFAHRRAKHALFCVDSALQFVSGNYDETRDIQNPPAYLVCSEGGYLLQLSDKAKCYPKLCSGVLPPLDESKHLSSSTDVGGGLSHGESIPIGCEETYVEAPAGNAAILRCIKGAYSIEYSVSTKCEGALCNAISYKMLHVHEAFVGYFIVLRFCFVAAKFHFERYKCF